MPNHRKESLILPWVTIETALKMLKMGNFGIFFLHQKRPNYENEANLCNILPVNDASIISAVPLPWVRRQTTIQ